MVAAWVVSGLGLGFSSPASGKSLGAPPPSPLALGLGSARVRSVAPPPAIRAAFGGALTLRCRAAFGWIFAKR